MAKQKMFGGYSARRQAGVTRAKAHPGGLGPKAPLKGGASGQSFRNITKKPRPGGAMTGTGKPARKLGAG